MSRVSVRRIDPGGLHGFRTGSLLLDDLTPGLNVFYAPNASGKSTLARAIGLLFCPERCDPDTTISGTVEGPGGTEERTVRKKDPTYNGFPGRPESYLLDLVSLLDGFRDKQEQAVLGRLVSSDVSLSPGTPTFRKPPSVRLATSNLDELRRVRRAADDASSAEDGLAALRAEAAEASEAGRLVGRLESFVERRRLEALRTGAEESLAEGERAHPGLERQSEGTGEMAKTLRHALTQAARLLQDAERERGEATPSHALGVSERAHVEAVRADVQDAETSIRTLEASRASAAARLKAAAGALLRLLPGEDPATLPHPTASDVEALRTAADEAEKREARRLRLEAYGAAFDGWRERFPDDGSDLGPMMEACRAWLAEEAVAAVDYRPPALLAIAGVGALASAFLGPLVALLAVVVAVAAFFALRPKGIASARGGIAARFSDFPKEATAVADRLRDLALRTARREVGLDLSSQARGTLPPSDWANIAEALRLRASDPLLLSPIVHSILGYEAARIALHESDAALDEARRKGETAREALRSVFRRYGFPDGGGATRNGGRRILPLVRTCGGGRGEERGSGRGGKDDRRASRRPRRSGGRSRRPTRRTRRTRTSGRRAPPPEGRNGAPCPHACNPAAARP